MSIFYPSRKPIRHKRKGGPRRGRLAGPALKQLRDDCITRDQLRCQNPECGRVVNPFLHFTHPLSAHMAHIQAKRRGGDNLENVRTLCGECHRAEHAGGKPCPPKPKAEEHPE